MTVNSSQLECCQKVPKGCALLRTTLALVLAVSEILVLSSGPAFLPPPQNRGGKRMGSQIVSPRCPVFWDTVSVVKVAVTLLCYVAA